MFEALDVDAGGAQYLPYAQSLLRGLKFTLNLMGLTHGRKHMITPDGSGYIYVRTRRGPASPNESPLPTVPFSPEVRVDEWYDYIRIEAGGSGYIPGLLISPIGTGFSPYSIQIAKDAKFKPFLGYSDLSLTPQLTVVDIRTSALQSAGSLRGHFSKRTFLPYAVSGSTHRGAFKHKYTEDGEEKTRILKVASNGHIIDAETDTNLTRTGTFFSSPNDLTYAVSDDGRTMIAEDTPTLGAAGQQIVPTRNVRRVDIDFVNGVAQATWSTVTDATPFGTGSSTTVGGALTNTRAGSYPAVRAPSHEGTIDTILIDDSVVATGSWDFCFPATLPSVGSGTVGFVPDYDSTSRSLTTSITGSITVKIPGGVEQPIPMVQTTHDWSASGGSSLAILFDQVSSVLGIIYADPQNKFLLYAHHILTASYSGSGNPNWSHVGGNIYNGSLLTTGSATFTRKVGVLFGDTHRVLHTEVSDSYPLDSGHSYFSGVLAKTGFPTVRSGSVAVSMHAATPIPPADGGSSFSIVENPVFFKQLKCVNTPHQAPFPEQGGVLSYVGHLDRARLFPHDVGGSNMNTSLEPRYWVSVRSPEQWIVGMHRQRSLNVANEIINDFQLFSGNLDETKLRQNYLDYLLTAANAAGSPDQTMIDTFEGGGFGSYDVGLSSVSRIPMV